MNITFKKDVSKLHLLETRFSKKTIACAITLSLGISAIPLSSFAATISGVRFVDSNSNNVYNSGVDSTVKGGGIYLKPTTASATQRPTVVYADFTTGTYQFTNIPVGSYKVWQGVDPLSPVATDMVNNPIYLASETNAKIINISGASEIVTINFPVLNLTAVQQQYVDKVKTIANNTCGTSSSLPTGSNVVQITSSTTTLPSVTPNTILVIAPNVSLTLTAPIHVRTVCNYGTLLTTNPAQPLSITYNDFFGNLKVASSQMGKIVSANATGEANGGFVEIMQSSEPACSAQYENAYGVNSCSEYFGVFYNEASIKSGSGFSKHFSDTAGLTDSSYVSYIRGNGGSVNIDVAHYVNSGLVETGNGGNLSFDKSYHYYQWGKDFKAGGDGGDISISVGIGVGKVITTANSFTLSGAGGDVTVTQGCLHSASNPVPYAGGCNYKIQGGDAGDLMSNGAFMFNGGTYKGSSIWIDPSISIFNSDTTLIADQDITIYGGDDWLLKLEDLRPESIVAGRKIILATGAGGTIDLRGNNANIFKAGDKVEIFTDNLLLDAGVTIESLVSAPNGVTRSGAKIIYHATISGSSQFTVKAGETINAQLDLRNAGPKVDTYTLKATTQDGVTVNGLPASATVDGLKSAPLDLSVVMPANLSTESTTITITATSQADPSVVATFELRLNVPQTNCAEPATYDTSTRTVSLSKIDIPLLSPIDGKETGEIAVFSAQLEQVSGVEDFKIKPNSLQFLSFSKAYDPSHARYSFNTGLFSNGGLLKTCVAVPQIIVIPPNTPIYTDPKHYLVTLRQLAVSPDTFHVESVDAANP